MTSSVLQRITSVITCTAIQVHASEASALHVFVLAVFFFAFVVDLY